MDTMKKKQDLNGNMVMCTNARSLDGKLEELEA